MGINDRRRLRAGSSALNVQLPGGIQNAAVELVVALANHDTHRNLQGVRAKARALFDSESLSTITVGEWREWARQAYGWLLVAAGAKARRARSLHTVVRGVVKRKGTNFDQFMEQRNGEPGGAGQLAEAWKAWKSAAKSKNRRFVRAVTRFARYVRADLIEHLKCDFTSGEASPIELAAAGAALVMNSKAKLTSGKRFQRQFGLCRCGTFFFKPKSRGPCPPEHCCEDCRAGGEQERRYRRSK